MRSVTPFGQYQLLDRLAVGGMAELFLAVRTGDAGFQKACVVKRVLPYLAENPEFVQMFLDEARIAARLEHPGVVQVFELGKHEASYFIAMEYLAGTDLARLMRRVLERGGQIPAEVATRVVVQAAEALHFAHELKDEKAQPLGIVHRDISPSNLFVTCQGAVKVLDFGVAFAREREQRTETGQVKGKAGYMSPEQCLGHAVDHRTDVWALGVVAHELLSGQRLFDGKTTAQSALAVCQKPIVPLKELRPDLPIALSDAIGRALERDAAARWPSALALQSALEAAQPKLADAKALAAWLREQFGEPWVEEQLARSFAPTALVRGGGTEPLQAAVGAADPPTQPASAVVSARRPATMRRGALLGALATAAAGAAALLLWPASPSSNERATGPTAETATRPVPAPAPSPPPAAAPTPPTTSEGPAREPVAIEKVRTSAPARPNRAAARPRPEPPERASKVASSATGRVSLVTQPYAKVSFKGRDLGPTPLFDVELPAGKQQLTLIGEDGVARTLEVSVQEAAATQLRLRLDKLPPSKPR